MKPKLNLNPCGQSVIQDVFSQLTPTTIRKIDNLFSSNGSNQTGPSSSLSNQCIEESWYMDPWVGDYHEVTGEEKMNNAYLLSGGSTTMVEEVKEEPASEDMSEEEEVAGWIQKTNWDGRPSKKRQRRGNSKNDYDGLSPADRQRLLLKRERNKQAAARCRQRREDLIQTLSDKVKKNEAEKNRHLKEIQDLRRHKMALEELLRLHKDGSCLLAQNKNPATHQVPAVKFPRPMSLNIPPPVNLPNLQNQRYTIDTPQSRLYAFDNIPTGLSPDVELNAAQPFQEDFQNAPYLTSNGKSMTVL